MIEAIAFPEIPRSAGRMRRPNGRTAGGSVLFRFLFLDLFDRKTDLAPLINSQDLHPDFIFS